MVIREHKGKSLLVNIDDYCVVDIETTGLSSNISSIIEISAIKVRNGKEVDTFSMLVNPHCRLPSFIVSLTGITDTMLNDASDIDDVLLSFIKFVKDDIIVGHNVNFDINFLYDAINRHLGMYFENDFVDTLRIARRVLDLSKNTLDDLVSYFNIESRDKHRALNDCSLTNKVYRELKDLL